MNARTHHLPRVGLVRHINAMRRTPQEHNPGKEKVDYINGKQVSMPYAAASQ